MGRRRPENSKCDSYPVVRVTYSSSRLRQRIAGARAKPDPPAVTVDSEYGPRGHPGWTAQAHQQVTRG